MRDEVDVEVGALVSLLAGVGVKVKNSVGDFVTTPIMLVAVGEVDAGDRIQPSNPIIAAATMRAAKIVFNPLPHQLLNIMYSSIKAFNCILACFVYLCYVPLKILRIELLLDFFRNFVLK